MKLSASIGSTTRYERTMESYSELKQALQNELIRYNKANRHHEKCNEHYSRLMNVPKGVGHYVAASVGCAMVLVVDYWVNGIIFAPIIQNTLTWIPALIMTVLDAVIALYATGHLARSVIQRHRQSQFGVAIVVLLGLIKLALFVVEQRSGSDFGMTSRFMQDVIVVLIPLVVILYT